MNKEIQKTQSQQVGVPTTKKEVLDKFSELNFYENHPDSLYKNISEILAKISSGEECSHEEQVTVTKGLFLNSTDKSHYFLSETLDGGLDVCAVEMTNNLIEEYNCNTTLEKSLCEMISLNYAKTMQLSRNFTNCMNVDNKLSSERTKYLHMLRKEIDRSNRSYLMSLNNLIEIKRPKMNINVKSKNTYIGQNQEFNTNPNKSENIRA